MIHESCISGSPPGLPYCHLNLRHNPFGELDLARRAELAVVDAGPLVERLLRPGCAVQFLGDAGRGKTTHLLAIGRCFDHAAYVRIEEDGPPPPFPQGYPLLIDEAQRLPRRVRRQVFRGPVSVALASHRDLGIELRRAGLDVHTVRIGQHLPPARLCEMLNRRVEAARRGAGQVPRLTLAAATQLVEHFGTDIRAIEGHLYERFQHLAEVGHA
jgi:hypothetical protein